MADWEKFTIGGKRCASCGSLTTPAVIRVDTGVFKGANADSCENMTVWKCVANVGHQRGSGITRDDVNSVIPLV